MLPYILVSLIYFQGGHWKTWWKLPKVVSSFLINVVLDIFQYKFWLIGEVTLVLFHMGFFLFLGRLSGVVIWWWSFTWCCSEWGFVNDILFLLIFTGVYIGLYQWLVVGSTWGSDVEAFLSWKIGPNIVAILQAVRDFLEWCFSWVYCGCVFYNIYLFWFYPLKLLVTPWPWWWWVDSNGDVVYEAYIDGLYLL